jgi:hypothetical protein
MRLIKLVAQPVFEVINMENGVVRYGVEIHSDDLKNWPPVSSFVALNVL